MSAGLIQLDLFDVSLFPSLRVFTSRFNLINLLSKSPDLLITTYILLETVGTAKI